MGDQNGRINSTRASLIAWSVINGFGEIKRFKEQNISQYVNLGSTHKVQVNPGRSLFDWAMKPSALRRLGHHIV